jgi:hypothetical protein
MAAASATLATMAAAGRPTTAARRLSLAAARRLRRARRRRASCGNSRPTRVVPRPLTWARPVRVWDCGWVGALCVCARVGLWVGGCSVCVCVCARVWDCGWVGALCVWVCARVGLWVGGCSVRLGVCVRPRRPCQRTHWQPLARVRLARPSDPPSLRLPSHLPRRRLARRWQQRRGVWRHWPRRARRLHRAHTHGTRVPSGAPSSLC